MFVRIEFSAPNIANKMRHGNFLKQNIYFHSLLFFSSSQNLFFAVIFSFAVCLALCSCLVVGAKDSANENNTKLRAQGRADISKKSPDYKVRADMQSVMQQHLVGPVITNPHHNDKTEMRGNSGSSKEEGKKGRLQTVGSVLGDIIGVLISEVTRFFGSVVSDVAREVTAHGFVSLFKQFADFTGLSLSTVTAPVAPQFG